MVSGRVPQNSAQAEPASMAICVRRVRLFFSAQPWSWLGGVGPCSGWTAVEVGHGGGVGLGDILRNTARHPGALRSGVNTHHAADDACASGAHPEPDARGHLCIGCTFGCSLGRDGRRVLRVCGCACSWPVRRLCAVWGGSCCCCWASTGSAVPGLPNVNPKSVRRDRHNWTCSPADTSWLPSSGVAPADLPANDPVHHPGRI